LIPAGFAQYAARFDLIGPPRGAAAEPLSGFTAAAYRARNYRRRVIAASVLHFLYESRLKSSQSVAENAVEAFGVSAPPVKF